MPTVIGVDFGTTNSVVALNKQGSIEVLDTDRDEEDHPLKQMRSVIYFDEVGKAHVGDAAIRGYVEDPTGRFMRSIKTLLPSSSFTSTQVRSKSYKAEDLVALILRALHDRTEEITQLSADEVIIGRPVVFSTQPDEEQLAQTRLLAAANLAGFKHVAFQLEPIAAALAYESTLDAGKQITALVGDFGGGTTDFTIVNLRGTNYRQPTDRRQDVLATSGVYMGGDTIDSILMWEKMAKYFGRGTHYKTMEGRWADIPSSITTPLRNWYMLPQLRDRRIRDLIRTVRAYSDAPETIANLEDLVRYNCAFELFGEIEKAKCALSTADQASIVFEAFNKPLVEDVTRIELEGMIQSMIQKVSDALDEVIRRSSVSVEKIDRVFLTGGTSYIPIVRALFTNKFGNNKVIVGEAFTSVAYGLSLSSYLL